MNNQISTVDVESFAALVGTIRSHYQQRNVQGERIPKGVSPWNHADYSRVLHTVKAVVGTTGTHARSGDLTEQLLQVRFPFNFYTVALPVRVMNNSKIYKLQDRIVDEFIRTEDIAEDRPAIWGCLAEAVQDVITVPNRMTQGREPEKDYAAEIEESLRNKVYTLRYNKSLMPDLVECVRQIDPDKLFWEEKT